MLRYTPKVPHDLGVIALFLARGGRRMFYLGMSDVRTLEQPNDDGQRINSLRASWRKLETAPTRNRIQS